jgi:hypothetical protein
MNAVAPSVRALLALCLLVVGFTSPRDAQADPLSPWPGEPTPTRTLALIPLLYVSADGKSFFPLLYGSTGLGDTWDVYAGLGGKFGAGPAELTLLDVFPRFHLTPRTALALRAQLAPGRSLALGAEVHSTHSWGAFSLVANAGVRPEFPLPGGKPSGTFFAILGPEYHFTRQFSVYCELNPSLTFTPVPEGDPSSPWGVKLTVVPGLSFALDPEQKHEFSLGAELALPLQGPFEYTSAVTFGAWYATFFDFGLTREKAPGSGTSDAAARLSSRW